jgi:hypothetical protein
MTFSRLASGCVASWHSRVFGCYFGMCCWRLCSRSFISTLISHRFMWSDQITWRWLKEQTWSFWNPTRTSRIRREHQNRSNRKLQGAMFYFCLAIFNILHCLLVLLGGFLLAHIGLNYLLPASARQYISHAVYEALRPSEPSASWASIWDLSVGNWTDLKASSRFCTESRSVL